MFSVKYNNLLKIGGKTMKRIICLVLTVLLLVSITGCSKGQKAQKDHECQYEVIKLEKDICVWTAEVLTAEKIDNVKVFVKRTYHEGNGFLDIIQTHISMNKDIEFILV